MAKFFFTEKKIFREFFSQTFSFLRGNPGYSGMHVFVNDWDIINWNMFMYVGNWQPKFKGHHFKGIGRIGV